MEETNSVGQFQKINVKANNTQESHIQTNTDAIPFDAGNIDVPTINTETQAESALGPAIQNGNTQYNQIMSQLIQTQEWSALPQSEKNIILNLTEQQKVIVNIILQANSGSNVDWNRLKHCGLAALGIDRAKTILISAFRTGMTASTAIEALAFIGKRYLGYIALAFAIYEFTECILSNSPSEDFLITQPYASIGNDNLFIMDHIAPGFLHWNGFSTYAKYFSYELLQKLNYSQLLSFQPINLFYDNGKFYTDPTHTQFVADGYYQNEMIEDGYIYIFIEIKNGSVIHAIGKPMLNGSPGSDI